MKYPWLASPRGSRRVATIAALMLLAGACGGSEFTAADDAGLSDASTGGSSGKDGSVDGAADATTS
ncbi:MAG TPA: hypothetical protein PLI95_26700, partial [Polyangiaceae bacterium]|nr:hypothetical protein [Polyangiaceae bacterium]